jgi:hypothetical protein
MPDLGMRSRGGVRTERLTMQEQKGARMRAEYGQPCSSVVTD